ncbi:hypothetical protein TSUD_412970 [Trifolium subterraneum]|uniref:RNase H type-1 domain-containing protein n=1 Tax=Trifolium subterraneum TaxID=3900 RepID=A0A2Z6PUA0_TRISU|nr:hypothetical protein TSUD_412970 [Trifolium subterraneum]
MDALEQENAQLQEQVTTFRAELDRVNALVEALVAAQNRPPTPQAPVISEIVSTPIPATHGGHPGATEIPTPTIQHAIPVPRSGTPLPQIPVPVSQPTTVVTSPVIHVTLHDNEPIYHAENMRGYSQMDEILEKFDDMQQEIKALRGKDLFGKNAHDLCLVPNIQIPAKFKVPDFEKYKGNTCPQSHLVMYARKTSTQTDNDQLLIHYFQDSLTGAALKWYMSLDGVKIRTFNDLGEAFVRQYKHNLDMAPNRDQLQAMSQKDKETFKEYAQRWREVAAQVNSLKDEDEMARIFLNTLSPFYYERMVTSSTNDFTELVNIGVRLEEGVRQGRLVKENVPTNNVKKFGNNFQRKKEQEVSMVAHGRPQQRYTGYQHVTTVSQSPGYRPQFQQRPQQQYQQPYQQQYQQQILPQYAQQNRAQRSPPQFDPIPMKADLSCAFHQGAPGHDIEHCFALKSEVQRLIRANVLSFKDVNLNVQANPLPNHGAASVNMVFGCPGKFQVFDIRHIREPLVLTHKSLCKLFFFKHDYEACPICPNNPRGCQQVRNDIQSMLDRRELQITYKRNEDEDPNDGNGEVFVIIPEFDIPEHMEVAYNSQQSIVTPLVISLPGPMPYISEKAIPYKYNATMIENGHEVPIPALPPSVNIAEVSRVTRSGRVFPPMVQKKSEDLVSKEVREESRVLSPDLNKGKGQSSGTRPDSDFDEILELIKKSEYKVVDQLMQTPSKISVLSLLLNSGAHREALMKVLDQAFVDHDVSGGQFGGIVGNITACNNLSFSDEELPEGGRNHNLALHISMNCNSDALSNVLVDTGSSLNVMPKATLARLSYQGAPMRHSGVVVKAFDGSKKPVIGEVDLPMMIGPHLFQITFQVMDIQAAYSCLLGRPWIHDSGAVTSTLHQKLKFVKNGKLVIVGGEQALLVSHLSSFSFISASDVDGTQFQGLSLDDKNTKKNVASISSFRDAQEVVQNGLSAGWGQVVTLPENKYREGVGFSPSSTRVPKRNVVNGPIKDTFYSAGFIHPPLPEVNVIIEDDSNVGGMHFQSLSLNDKHTKKNVASISSLRDAQEVVRNGLFTGWGRVVTLPENKHREGLGFSLSSARLNVIIKPIEDTFYSAGFIRPEASAIIEDDPDVVGTQFQGLSLDDDFTKKNKGPMASLKDAQEIVQNVSSAGWGRVVILPENKHREGLGFSPPSAKTASPNVVAKPIEDIFYSAGFIHLPSPEVNAITEDGTEEDLPSFVTRGVMLLSEYDIEYRTQKAIKGSIIDDHLAHQPIDDYQSIKFDFPDKEIMYLKMKDCEEPLPEEGPDPESRWGLIFDGAVNAYGNGIGAVIITPKGTHIPFSARLLFDCTNNIAEYEACIMGIEEAIDLRIKVLDIYGDSALVINQIKGEWETRHQGLIPYKDYARRLLTFFNKVELHHIPWEENQMADALATLSSMFEVSRWNDMPRISIRRLERLAHVFAIEEVVDINPWFHDIKQFLQSQEYPLGASNKDKKTLRRLSVNFFLNEGILYKRNFDMVLLRCVDKLEAEVLMNEVHEGFFGTHSNGHAMAKKVLRAGYYWMTMESDCCKHVRRCHKCEIYDDKIHVPPTLLNVLSSPWPFSMWGIDMIGMIEPKASNGHRFILVAIDYFTKWVEAASYVNVTRQVVVKFIKNQLICRKVRPREFKEGDLVLKKILSFQPDSRGKWTPKYEGPYVVRRAFSGGAMTLATMDGDELPRPVNADAVKKYFV